jgi:multidrug efflux pump subunit AcrA (membrane-fusion protein)
MKAGMVVTLQLLSGTANQVLALPTEAVLEKSGMKYVFVLDGDSAKEVTVGTGFISDTMIEITEGLYDGQTVITTGNQLIKDGQKVSLPTVAATTQEDSVDENS